MQDPHRLAQAAPSLAEQIRRIETDLADYQDLITRLDAFGAPADAAPGSANTATSSIQTMTELGAGLFVDVAIPQPQTILLDLGLDIHLDLPIEAAKAYSSEKIALLSNATDWSDQIMRNEVPTRQIFSQDPSLGMWIIRRWMYNDYAVV